jgi:hypothetical protein
MDPELRQLAAQVAEARATDPTAGVRTGAVHLVNYLEPPFRVPQGVKLDLVLAALGAVAGHTALTTAVIKVTEAGGQPGAFDILTIETADGSTYYTGNAINGALFESAESVLGFAVNFAEAFHLRREPLPDFDELAAHVTSTMGTPAFGVIRWPGLGVRPNRPTVTALLDHFWDGWTPYFPVFCTEPRQWLILMGAAITDTLSRAQEIMPPGVALQIVMEAAMPASRMSY